jgi:hypothetical protein
MKAAEGSSRVLVTVPPDVRRWLEERAKFNGGTMSSEVTRALRSRMEKERADAGKDRATAATRE